MNNDLSNVQNVNNQGVNQTPNMSNRQPMQTAPQQYTRPMQQNVAVQQQTVTQQAQQPIQRPQVTQPIQQVNATPNYQTAQAVSQDRVNPMNAVSNLNKEDAMEEALSHTTQYSPFEVPKEEISQDEKPTSNKNAYIFLIIVFAIMLLFILFLPKITELIGW